VSADFNLSRIDKQRYRPATEVEDTLDELRRNLIVGEKFRVGRLAIARSLAEEELVTLLPKGTDMGTSIEGQTLFGDDTAIWATLIVEAADPLVTTVDQFKALVEAHWTRGAKLLQQDLENSDMRSARFITSLAAMAKQRNESTAFPYADENFRVPQVNGAISLKVGEVSTNVKNNETVSFTLNAPGVSPHISVLGKTRSGKTRTGLVMAEQIAALRALPMLLIDPKGEFISKGKFVKKTEWKGLSLADRFPGIRPLDVPIQPIPLDFLYRSPRPTPVELAQLAMGFKDSFQKCLRAKGDAALNTLRQSVQDLLTDTNQPVSLDSVLAEVQDANARQGRSGNTIEAKLSEMCALRLFEPTIPPYQFFAGRWAIGLAGC
jgi:DNA sulfur modification protein DndE